MDPFIKFKASLSLEHFFYFFFRPRITNLSENNIASLDTQSGGHRRHCKIYIRFYIRKLNLVTSCSSAAIQPVDASSPTSFSHVFALSCENIEGRSILEASNNYLQRESILFLENLLRNFHT